jgi:competence protein ComEA
MSRNPPCIVVIGSVLLAACVSVLAQSPDLPPSDVKDKVVKACTACHSADIIVQQRLSKGTWSKEMDKMTKWGASVNPADRDAIIEYLSVNFSPDKPTAVMPRSAASQ